MNRQRLRAEHAAQKFYNKRQNEPVPALAGDGAGHMDVPGRWQWIYARKHGDANQVIRVFNRPGTEWNEDDPIDLLYVKRTGLGYYEVLGPSGATIYDWVTPPTPATPAAHHTQHERRDLGAGGFDPVDVYARMVVPLRARAQTTPGLTLYVNEGPNPLTGKWFAGGNSPAFTAPVGFGMARWDLLYLGNDDALHILQGTAVAGSAPVRPDMPLGTVPLAYVYLAETSTTITENQIKDARLIVGFVSETGGMILSPLTDEDGLLLLDEDGNTLYDEG